MLRRYTFILMEPVHLSEQLVDCLIGVRMQNGIRSFGSNRIDLIDEDDARSAHLGCFEEITHSSRSLTN